MPRPEIGGGASVARTSMAAPPPQVAAASSFFADQSAGARALPYQAQAGRMSADTRGVFTLHLPASDDAVVSEVTEHLTRMLEDLPSFSVLLPQEELSRVPRPLSHMDVFVPEPVRPPLLCVLAWLHWARGQRALAMAYGNEASRIEPEHVLSHGLSGVISSKLPVWVTRTSGARK